MIPGLLRLAPVLCATALCVARLASAQEQERAPADEPAAPVVPEQTSAPMWFPPPSDATPSPVAPADPEAMPAEPAAGGAMPPQEVESPVRGAEGAGFPPPRGPKKQVYGWIEDVLIDPEHALKLPAKLDTGADTTSLDARNIRRTRRNGEDYVRFVVTEPATGQSVELEKPFVRAVRIKAAQGNEALRRVVVRMRICIGDRSRSVEVNLVDRGHYEFPLLLGRNALRDVAVIDPNLRRTREPSCWSAADSWASAPAAAAGGDGHAVAASAPAAFTTNEEAAAGDDESEESPPADTPESNGGDACENAPMC
jgi:hypothetical protein